MKLEPVTKLDKANVATLKKLGDDVMSTNCGVMVFFPIYGQFAAIRILDSGRMVYKTYIFIKNNLLSSNRTKKSLTQLLYYCFE